MSSLFLTNGFIRGFLLCVKNVFVTYLTKLSYSTLECFGANVTFKKQLLVVVNKQSANSVQIMFTVRLTQTNNHKMCA